MLPTSIQIPGANALTSTRGVRYSSQGPAYGREQFLHSGADFPGKIGEPVIAIMPGEVTGVFAHRAEGKHEEVSGYPRLTAKALKTFKAPYGFGLYIIVRHPITVAGKHLYSGYHHLDSAMIRKGNHVTQGQPIGGMGKSGTNPIGGAVHLHLDVALVDPGADRSHWFFLDPRGFQKWTSVRAPGATDPGRGFIWPITEAIAAPAFPRSGTGIGIIGVDKPAPLINGYPITHGEGASAGLPIVAKGPGQPLDEFWRLRRKKPVLVAVASVATAVTAWGLSYWLTKTT